MNRSSSYRAGDIVLIAYPFTNLQGKKVRPALVIRTPNDEDLLLVPISTTVQRSRNDYLLKEQDYEGIPLPVLSCLRYEKLFTLNHALVVKKVTKLQRKTLGQIQQKLIDFITER